MGRKEYEVNVVDYAANSMDLDVKAEMEAAYADHLKYRTCNPIIQTRVIQAMLVVA